MKKPKPDEKTRELHKVYASGGGDRASEIYDGWAAEYEDHMRGAGYSHPAMVAAMLMPKLADKDPFDRFPLSARQARFAWRCRAP